MAVEKILILGASGFLGQALSKELSSNPSHSFQLFAVSLHSYEASGLSHFVCDLTHPKEVEDLVTQIAPDKIFHLAGLSRVSNQISLKDYFVSNVYQTQTVLNAITKLTKKVRFLLASSIHIYGNQLGHISEEASLKPQSAYAFSKYLAEEALKKACQSSTNLQGTIVRLSSCLGPGQPRGFVAADLIEKLKTARKNHETKILTGPLNGTRQFTDQRDIAKALCLLMNHKQMTPTEVYNLASPQDIEVGELLKLLMELTQTKVTVEPEVSSHNLFRGLKINSDKFSFLFSDFSFRPLKETLSDMLKS